MLNERDLNQLLDELNTIAMELEPEFQRAEVRHSIVVARAKLAAKTSCNHSIEKSFESLSNADKDYFSIMELCKLTNTYLTSGELVKAKEVLKETTKSVHQLESEHERSRAFFAIQRELLGIVESIHNWCAIQSITEVIDTISRQIEVSENLFWKLEKMRVNDKLDYFEDLLWKLIGESRTDEPADKSGKGSVFNEESIYPTRLKEPEYIGKYRVQLKNPNSQPGKIKRYIEEKGVVTWGDLKRACLNQLGFKSIHGGVNATINVLEYDGKIKIDGRGNGKRIKYLQP